MAVYDGFFDAVLDPETGKFDREYNSEDFTGYFASFLGDGVCLWRNADSLRVTRQSGGAADAGVIIAPGYLFFQGFWLKNDSPYSVAGLSGEYVVAARLNTAMRFMELTTLPKADSYPNCLVLAQVDAAGNVADTRHDPDLCGVISTVGELSAMAEYAIDYIDNQIEDRLQEAEAQIAAQSAELDEKIAQVEGEAAKLSPPPVGTVKFTASQTVEPGWLRCDGSFVSEDDYPELVQALGKVTPGVEAFTEAYGEQIGGNVTNGVLFAGAHWLFSLTDHALYRYDTSTKSYTSIPVSGTDSLQTPTANPIWLSISGGSLFLSQFQGGNKTVVLLTCAFTGGESQLVMNALPVQEAISQYISGITNAEARPTLPGDHFLPEVCEVDYDWDGTEAKSFLMCLGHDSLVVRGTGTSSSTYYYSENIYYIVWKTGDFTSRKVAAFSAYSGTGSDSKYDVLIKQAFRASHKNSNEIVYLHTNYIVNTGSNADLMSSPAGLYTASQRVQTGAHSDGSDTVTTTCIAANNRYLYRCFVKNRKLIVRAGKYNPMTLFYNTDIQPGLTLPSRAQVFPDSVCYAAGQDIWFVFLGTGLAFSQTPEDGTSWGYLDTQDTLGVISRFGSLEMDEEENILYISGQDTLNHGRLGVLTMPDLYNYANDGAWLPNIASDGVPAYIKAQEQEAAE